MAERVPLYDESISFENDENAVGLGSGRPSPVIRCANEKKFSCVC